MKAICWRRSRGSQVTWSLALTHSRRASRALRSLLSWMMMMRSTLRSDSHRASALPCVDQWAITISDTFCIFHFICLISGETLYFLCFILILILLQPVDAAAQAIEKEKKDYVHQMQPMHFRIACIDPQHHTFRDMIIVSGSASSSRERSVSEMIRL